MALSLPHAESRISGSLHHLLDVDHAGYPALLCNSQFKGIRADRPPAQFTNAPHGSTPPLICKPSCQGKGLGVIWLLLEGWINLLQGISEMI